MLVGDAGPLMLLSGFGGPGRDRTDDLFHAMEARSQLRHRPTFGRLFLFSVTTHVSSNRLLWKKRFSRNGGKNVVLFQRYSNHFDIIGHRELLYAFYAIDFTEAFARRPPRCSFSP